MTSMKENKYAVEIPVLVKKMEEALLRGQMERFQSLSKQRSKSLHVLCEERQVISSGVADDSDETLNQIDEIIRQAIEDNRRMINAARQAASATQQKITQNGSRKRSTLRLAHGYGHGWLKVFSSGNMMSVNG